MMYKLFAVSTVLLACACFQSSAESVKVADARMDQAADSDGFVIFISKRLAAKGLAGQAIVAVGKGDAPNDITIEAAFGLCMDGGVIKLGKVPPENIAAQRASEEGQPMTTLIARVNTDVYETALGKVKAWEKGEDITPGAPANKVLEVTNIMLITIKELKKPYRSAFNSDTQTYFEDLYVLNRNK